MPNLHTRFTFQTLIGHCLSAVFGMRVNCVLSWGAPQLVMELVF
jgi:hypothetical protein